MKHLCLKETQGKMKMSFPQSLSGNPEDKRTGFPRIKYGAGSVKHGMTGMRGFSGKVSSSKLQVQNFFKELPTVYCSPPHPPLSKGGRRGGNKGFTPHHVCSAGFTLIETIVVMVIIAILAAVIILRNPFDSLKLSSATRKVAADIRYVQKLAISTQTRCGIYFISISSYRIFENNDTEDPARSPGDPCSDNGGNFEVDFNAGRCSNYSGVTFTAMPTVYFNSIGAPDSAATVIVSYKGSTQPITIEAGTGRVSY